MWVQVPVSKRYIFTVKLYFPDPNSFGSFEPGKTTVAVVFAGISIS
jgi:hypothetical protein